MQTLMMKMNTYLAGDGVAHVLRVQPCMQRRQIFEICRRAPPATERFCLPLLARLQHLWRKDALVRRRVERQLEPAGPETRMFVSPKFDSNRKSESSLGSQAPWRVQYVTTQSAECIVWRVQHVTMRSVECV